MNKRLARASYIVGVLNATNLQIIYVDSGEYKPEKQSKGSSVTIIALNYDI